MKNIIIILVIVIVASCSNNEVKIPQQSKMYEFASPVYTSEEGTEIYLNGFFKNVDLIDSVYSQNYTTELSLDKKWLVISPTENTKSVEDLTVWINGYNYTIIILFDKKTEYTFQFNPNGKQYKSVQIKGNFNSWTPSENFILEDSIWKYKVKLAPGKYHYQLAIDGNWILDPGNPINESNNIGGFNSVINIPDPGTNAPKLLTNKYSENQISIQLTGSANSIIALWDNFSIPTNIIDNKIQITIPKIAENRKRSFIRVWACNENGYSNDILVPLNNGKVVSDISEINRTDKHAQVLYFMLVDRFNNGNTEIDNPVNDPEIADKANYYGGDIQGVTNKVNDSYFKDLGISMIWLSPITQNPLKGYIEYPAPHRKYSGYHGYWPITLTTVDHRFGNSVDLHNLVKVTHENDMNIILDYVSNHVHEENNIYKTHPEWATILNLPDGRKNIRIWDEHRLTTWFDTFLPSLNFDIPEVEELMSDSAKFWIDEYNVDGFRHDATKHIPTPYWRSLTKKLREESNKKFIFQIGETFGSRELIRSYVGTDMLDGQFDFNLYFDMRNNFAQESEPLSNLTASLIESLKYNGHHSLMGNITGNHDLPRFITFASGALKFDEDDKEAGWNRDIQNKDTTGYYKLLQVTTFINTIPGIPVIYYGDEIGMPGAGDPDNRRPMKFENLTKFEKLVKDNTTKIVNLRRNNLELIYGDIIILYSDKESLVYARKYFNETSIIAFNKSDHEKEIIIDLPESLNYESWISNFKNSYSLLEENQLVLNLKPFSFEILNNN
ncbi:MAG: alpha-amylase family glycosyl hydrolase [Bacteroidales bacterium]|jgi:cyclomaltodextrinase|nr:alpha-amylase family glycosyl hydrolase [Bacteroidales bacterium]